MISACKSDSVGDAEMPPLPPRTAAESNAEWAAALGSWICRCGSPTTADAPLRKAGDFTSPERARRILGWMNELISDSTTET